MTVSLHMPHFSGHPARSLGIYRFLDYAAASEGV